MDINYSIKPRISCALLTACDSRSRLQLGALTAVGALTLSFMYVYIHENSDKSIPAARKIKKAQ